MKTIEDLNASENLSPPTSYHLPNLCVYCLQSREADSMVSPLNAHPANREALKCKLHNCWVFTSGVCDDYQMFKRVDIKPQSEGL